MDGASKGLGRRFVGIVQPVKMLSSFTARVSAHALLYKRFAQPLCSCSFSWKCAAFFFASRLAHHVCMDPVGYKGPEERESCMVSVGALVGLEVCICAPGFVEFKAQPSASKGQPQHTGPPTGTTACTTPLPAHRSHHLLKVYRYTRCMFMYEASNSNRLIISLCWIRRRN